jgi:predicted DNA binding CopG/RHH family protein
MKKTVNIPNIGIAQVSDYVPDADTEKTILEFEEQAEKDINELKKPVNVNFRWNELEVKRAKKIAAKLGLPYQSYLKSVIKQALDKDELKYN